MGRPILLKQKPVKAFKALKDFVGFNCGGDEGDRTPDLGIANAALSHLSYIPKLQEHLTAAPGAIPCLVRGADYDCGLYHKWAEKSRPKPRAYRATSFVD